MNQAREEFHRMSKDDGTPRESQGPKHLATRLAAAVLMKPEAFAARARAAQDPAVSDGIGRRRNLVPTSAAAGPWYLRSTTIQTWED